MAATLVVIAALTTFAVPSALAATRTETASSTTITLPYLGSDTRPIPAGWMVTACPKGRTPDLVTLTCDDGEITFTATDFDRGQGRQSVTVGFTKSGVATTTTYRVSLGGPQLNLPTTTTYRYPLPQGTPTTVPYTALRYSCEACTSASPQFRSGSVTPKAAGSVRFSGTGVVFSPAPDFHGRATLHYRLRDRFGQQTPRANVRVTVVPGTSHAPTMVATSATVATSTAARPTSVRGDAMRRDIAEKKHPATLTSCGTAFHGTVTCKTDGTFTYRPKTGFTGIDEFGYHVFTRSTGDQAVGTVLVAVGGAGAAADDTSGAETPLQKAIAPGTSSQRVPILTPLTYREAS